MTESKDLSKRLSTFGRSFFLLFNRLTIYDANHPYSKRAIDDFMPTVLDILGFHSPLVFIMNQEQFFVDDEPVDPRINISKMLAHFKKEGIQSISFYKGLTKTEMMNFVEIFTSSKKYPDEEGMKKALNSKGITNIKINHVFFKKVTTDQEIVSKEALEKVSQESDDGVKTGSKKMFMDMVLESILMEEFNKTLTIKRITESPGEVSKNMIESDLTAYRQSDAGDRSPGIVLVHQLRMIEQEVERHLGGGGGAGSGTGVGAEKNVGIGAGVGNGMDDGGHGGSGTELSELAVAIFDMKKQLINGIELQKSLGISYSNEEEILGQVDAITDRVLIQLVQDEYKAGQITPARLAQILKRLVPDVKELKRILPKIKEALLSQGMPLSDYLVLVQELSGELQSEELSKLLYESAEMVGLDGSELIEEVKNNPVQAAELIFLAAEIRKGSKDENVLTDLLVDYVERLGSKLTLNIAKEENVEGEQHLRQVMNKVDSQILGRLRNMDVGKDVLDRLEEKLNSRMDEIFEALKGKWISYNSDGPQKEEQRDLSILEILEQSVEEGDELGRILKMVRREAREKGLDENDFKEILTEITSQKERKLRQKDLQKILSQGLDPETFMYFLEKEISRASRYDLPFATLSFSVVSAKPLGPVPSGEITQDDLVDATLQRLIAEIRGADVATLLDKNRFVALLPMTPPDEAKLALKRHLRLFNTKQVEVRGQALSVKVAGVATNFNQQRMPNAQAFVQILTEELSDMVVRIKTLHGLT